MRSTASGATSKPTCATTPSCCWPGSTREPRQPDAVRSGLAPGRDRHPRRARQGKAAPPHLRLRPRQPGELKASGRSIPGLHLRDALDLVAKRHPDLLLRFGGHAAAAGLTLRDSDLPRFEAAFEQVCGELLSPAELSRTLETDGALESGYYSIDAVRMMQQEVWGQAFPPPLFADRFEVLSQRILKDKHLKLRLQKGGQRFDAIRFNAADAAPDRITAAFRVDINEWNGTQSVQLLLEHFEAAN
jgi:single-stranded-DNA-specific exonuclease